MFIQIRTSRHFPKDDVSRQCSATQKRERTREQETETNKQNIQTQRTWISEKQNMTNERINKKTNWTARALPLTCWVNGEDSFFLHSNLMHFLVWFNSRMPSECIMHFEIGLSYTDGSAWCVSIKFGPPHSQSRRTLPAQANYLYYTYIYNVLANVLFTKRFSRL